MIHEELGRGGGEGGERTEEKFSRKKKMLLVSTFNFQITDSIFFKS